MNRGSVSITVATDGSLKLFLRRVLKPVRRRAFCSYLRRGKSNESSGVERKSNIFVNSPSRQKWHSNIRSSALSGLYSSGPNVLPEVVLGFELTDPVLELHIAKSMPTV